VSTAQDLPVAYGEPAAPPALRLLPSAPLDFDEAVLHLRPRLHRYAIRRLGDTHEAEELVQEALLRAYTHREQLGTADDLAAWATVVTGRLVIDRLRVRGRYTAVADVPEGSRVGRDTAEVVVARDEARLALDALDAMPPRQASLLWAREVEGQSYEELCERFGMTEPAVRSVLTRARKALRKEYSSRGGTLPVGGLAVLAPWVAGLGWADKLRRAATRVTAPAAMGAAGVTILGGLVLSPFATLPGTPAQEQFFRPSHAVVERTASDVLHGFAIAPHVHPVAAPHGPASDPAERKTLGDELHRGLSRLGDQADRCVDRAPDSRYPTVVVPGRIYAGSPKCDAPQSQGGNVLTLAPELPDNPTGITQVGIASSEVSCKEIPTNPLVICTSDTEQGAPQ